MGETLRKRQVGVVGRKSASLTGSSPYSTSGRNDDVMSMLFPDRKLEIKAQ